MFSRAQRLPREDFKRLFAKGVRMSTPHLVLQVYNRKGVDTSRIAVVIPKKAIKDAVGRNRLKRQIRNLVRSRWSDIPSGHDMLLTARGDFVLYKVHDLDVEIQQLLKEL